MTKQYVDIGLKKMILFLNMLLVLFIIGCSTDEVTKDVPPDPEPPTETDGVPKIDNAVQSFMREYDVTGASVAFTKNGKLVYAKGYGFADETTGEKVTTSSLFRISSISKSITSIAIMTLMEHGKLSLNDKVFGPDGILGTIYGTEPYGDYITDITIDHLLHHTGGGWGNQSDDPTMHDQSLTKEQLLTWILDNRPLDFAPGTRYSYSNVGYMILGMVIEELTNVSYAEYVKAEILEPIGVDMYIGGNTYEDRRPNEVRYHSSIAYNYNFERRDANGGWIATASNLLRLYVHVDGFDTVPDILTSKTIKIMTAPSYANENYACGFKVNSFNTWSHGGSFYGSRSFVVMRTQSGYSGVIFVNSTSGGNFTTDMRDVVRDAVDNNSIQWPDEDLF